MFRLLFPIFLIINVSLTALETSAAQKERMLADLNFIKKTFEESYAPAEWKRELFDWDLQSKFESVADEVRKSKRSDIKQFQKLLIDFCKSTRDYHVSISFSSTEYASLPFDVRCRNGKYIVTSIEKNETLPLEIGDEILTMNEVPIAVVITELQKEMGEENRTETDRALALEILTKRNGRLGHQVPQGSVTIEVKKLRSSKIETCQVLWNYKPERVSNPFINSLLEVIERRPRGLFLKEEFDQTPAIPYYEEMAEVFFDDGLPKDQLGSRKSVFSAMGKEKINELGERTAEEQISWIWNWLWRRIPEKAKTFFDAKLVELPSGKYAGYLRIPTFKEKDPEEALEAFQSCIEYFQSQADMLLIDQTNNPGGSPLYMYALLSMLTDYPLVTLKERKLLKQSDVLNAIERIDSFQDFNFDKFEGYTVLGFPLREFIQNSLKESHYILNQWEQGHLLTDPYPLLGIDVIKPHPKVNFTKPIFVLANEMSFSCADLFPALLQDNKRAIIIGTPTAGAGGTVNSLSFNNLNGISQLKYTTSIAYRFNGASLENLGVTPDIFFDFNNEMYDKNNVSPDFHKIYDILETMTKKSF